MHVREGLSIPLPRPLPVNRPVAPQPATGGDTFAGSVPTSAPQAPAKVGDAPLRVGDQRPFWVWDFAIMPPGPKQIQATLQSLGEKAQIWVDDASWNQTVKPADIATLEERFNRTSPAGSVNPSQSVVDIDKRYFGDLPKGIDADPRVTVLYTPFATFNGTSMDGYFNAFDQMTDGDAQQQQQRSNERNIIYLNSAGSPVAGDYMQGVLAHEFSHLLQFGTNPEQSSWIGETMAEAAMAVNGYHTDFNHVARHQKKPQNPLESETYVDYGACYLFGTYVLERYGAGFVSEVAAQPGSGREAVEKALQKSGTGDTFEGLVADWVVANYADAHGSIAPGHHYASLDIPAPAETVLAKGGDKAEGTLKPTGAAYVRVDAAGGATVHVEGGTAALRVMHFDGPRLQVDALDASRDVTLPQGAVLAVASVGTEPLKYSIQSAD